MDEPNSGFPTYMALHVWCREEVQCPSLQHLLITTPLNNDLTFTKLLVTKIHDMYNNTYPDLHAFITQVLSAGKVSIPTKPHMEIHMNIELHLKRVSIFML